MDRILRILPGGLRAAILAVLAAVGPVGALWSAEITAGPGPAIATPTASMQRLPSAENPAAAGLVEMPLAETSPSASEPSRVQTAGETDGPKSSPLAIAAKADDRSVQLEQVAQQADRQVRHGIELAGRGAHLAARAEFIGALRMIAAGLDAEQKTNAHVRALAAAMLAMKEAEDFLPGSAHSGGDADLSGVIAAHTTPVLKNEAETMTAMTALRHYLTFAQEQFATATGREVAGSMALHSLGKLHATLAQRRNSLVVAPESKAMVFFQSALLVYPQNYMAANDLGVLLAQCGHYTEARGMLEHSLSVCPQWTGWQNLAVVQRQLGQPGLAQRAAEQATMLRQAELARRSAPGAANSFVRWVEPQTFAQTATNMPRSLAVTPLVPMRTAGQPAQQGMAPPPMAQPASETAWPAPTPAAAERRMWSAPAYQR